MDVRELVVVGVREVRAVFAVEGAAMRVGLGLRFSSASLSSSSSSPLLSSRTGRAVVGLRDAVVRTVGRGLPVCVCARVCMCVSE